MWLNIEQLSLVQEQPLYANYAHSLTNTHTYIMHFKIKAE